ncbi:MAG: protease HtpX [Candidatus Cloacimonetes bacterium]|jgi:heat shock protein HtpX|nr:protease HtpX [Candidatus Cloacimonadota bacterium]
MKGIKRFGFYLMLNLLVTAMISAVLALFQIPLESVSGLLLMCLIFGFAGSLISLALSKTIAKSSYKIQLINSESPDPRLRNLYESIGKMADLRRVPMPEVGVYPSKDVNAFATGPSVRNSLIAFSSEMFNHLSDDEIAAVAAHELTHITEGDMVSMTLVMGLINTFVMFAARIIAAVLDGAMRDNKGRGGLGYFGYYIVINILQNVLMLLAMIPASAYSRHREYRADRGAAELTGPKDMIAALSAIEEHYFPSDKQDSFALAKINNKKKMSLFATHPPMADRIDRLSRM